MIALFSAIFNLVPAMIAVVAVILDLAGAGIN